MIFSERLAAGLLALLILLPGKAGHGASSRVEIAGFVTAVRGEVLVNGRPIRTNTPLRVSDFIETREGKCTLLLGKQTVMHLDSSSKLEISQYFVEREVAATSDSVTTVASAPENGESAKTPAPSPTAGAAPVPSTKESATLNLTYGRARALIKSGGTRKDLRIRSRAAVMGVRGTHVYLDNPADTTRPQQFLTIEGQAEVSVPRGIGAAAGPSQRVVLNPNQALSIASAPQADSGAGGAPRGREGGVQVVTLSADQARQLADSVAPPPQAPRSAADANRQAESDAPAPASAPEDSSSNTILRPPVLPIDPTRFGRTTVVIRVKGKRQ